VPRPILATLPFLAALATAPVAAQRAALPITPPDAVTRSSEASAAGTTRRIFTLTWVDERLPAGLVEASHPVPGPSGLEPRRIFTLVWQQVPGEPVAVHPARPVGPEACRIVTLVAQPCR
jgi:hypothetical protein